MKNKICNLIITILVIALIVVIGMIIIRYGKNYLNEKEISKTLTTMEEELSNQSLNNENEVLDVEYKGYKIEGIIEIPEINIKFSGPQANEIGNYCVAGHNNRDGTMFGKTSHLKIGDTIKLTNLKNETIEYKIFKIYSIDPSDVTCANSVDQTTRHIKKKKRTNGHKNRLITKARQII